METCLMNLIMKILWKELILQDRFSIFSKWKLGIWKSLKVDIIKCRFGIIDCTAMMKTVKTMYGYCKEGQPSRFIGIDHSRKKFEIIVKLQDLFFVCFFERSKRSGRITKWNIYRSSAFEPIQPWRLSRGKLSNWIYLKI